MIASRSRRLVGVVGAAIVALTGALTGASPVQAEPGHDLSVGTARRTYVVQMADLPVVAYDGSLAGLPATAPRAGQKINPNSAAVAKYVAHLNASHNAAAARVNARKIYDYHYTYNGFAAEMTEAAAEKLRGLPGVVAVSVDERLQRDTATTPGFLGLDAPGGLWEQLGGPDGGKKGLGAGEGVIVGIVDSGITPESMSFSDRDANGKRSFQAIPGWHGKCVPGEQFDASMCNQKLIGARYYNAGFGGNAGVKAALPYEFASARDYDGHGTHTASTAAGNYGVPVSLGGFDFGTVSGMAPRARVAAYKVCWGAGTDGGCYKSDSVAAIDQAVADGVDVINFSISGSTTSFLDPVEVAFLYAANAGVFVSASAGNSGPTASTVAHNSPWLTTVAASTHPRAGEGSFTVTVDGQDHTYTGASLGNQAGPAPFVEASAVGLAGAPGDEVRLCYPGTLDPELAEGTIVLCDRGVIARTDKSLAVQQAGGIGMILVNPSPSSLNADIHHVPTVHVDADVYDELHAHAATDGAMVEIHQAELVEVAAPYMAAFSSRGPALAGEGDILKPDVTAPGVDILAAVSPHGYDGRTYDFLSGTSMASPHVAGLGALMKDLHPTWSPAMIRSAFMTSAYDTLDGGVFDHGAGHVAPNSAADPGLVYDAGWTDWLGFLCGTGQLQASYCPSITIDPSDLNQASIAIGALAGQQTITRTVTNVGSSSATYDVSVEAPAGIDVVVEPATLNLAAGASASYAVTFTRVDAPLNAYASGHLTWSDGTHHVRSPIAVRPVLLAAPGEVAAVDDAASFEVGFGASGDFAVDVDGLIPAATQTDTVVDDPANDISTALATGVGITMHEVPIPAGTTYVRVALFDDYTSGDDDLDLYVFSDSGAFLGSSGSGTSAERFDLPTPGVSGLIVVVHGWQTDGGVPSDYTLFTWALDGADAGNATVTAPSSVALGDVATIEVALTGLDPAVKYLGQLGYTLAGQPAGSTIITAG